MGPSARRVAALPGAARTLFRGDSSGRGHSVPPPPPFRERRLSAPRPRAARPGTAWAHLLPSPPQPPRPLSRWRPPWGTWRTAQVPCAAAPPGTGWPGTAGAGPCPRPRGRSSGPSLAEVSRRGRAGVSPPPLWGSVRPGPERGLGCAPVGAARGQPPGRCRGGAG